VNASDPAKVELAIGLMSGTSQDGVDAVLARFVGGRFDAVVAASQRRYPSALRAQLLELSRESHPVDARTWARLDKEVADCFAEAAEAAITAAGLTADAISVIGSHGQTVFHDPDGIGSSLQIGDPALIAARSGATTVADFRRADIALGGQGAPLAPAFHHAVFASDDEPRAVLNLGGIANLTLLPNGDPTRVLGFDCGPANALLDDWAAARLGCDYDVDGRIAASGRPVAVLLQALLADPYYQRPPPKSTGRGQFRLAAVRDRFPTLDALAVEDVQRSFLELTVESVVAAVERFAPDVARVLVCGGGVANGFLMQRLAERHPGCVWQSTAVLGLDPQHIEGAAFAWLALRRLQGLPGNLPSVTGASRPALLGGIFSPG